VRDGLGLSPIAFLFTTRTVVTVLDSDGGMLAEIADDQVRAQRADAGEELRWREVEVEVPEGTPPQVAKSAAELLFAAGARPAAKGSKLARLLHG
jgi:hypothetical protein